MKTILSLLFFFTYLISYAQMGVGTTSPDVSAQLDISANDKGVLVPRISLTNVSQTTLDGSHTAATGLLIWNTNATTTGGNGVGFYFFNGVQWIPITQENHDADWFEENTTTPANAITDDIYTNGNVGIGVSNVQYPLQISSSTASRNLIINNTSNGSSIYSIYNNIIESSASTGNTIGLVNIISRTGQSSIIGVVNGFSNAEATVGYGYLFGYDNSFSSTTSLQSVGLINRFQGTTTSGYGVKNLMSGTATNYYGLSNYNLTSENVTATIYGLHNDLNGIGNGSRYGVYTNFTEIGGGAKYGEYIHIASGAGGTHYGIYADVTKATGYAGYFLGRVAIGSLSTNTYILPSSRGTNGQVMQTDGSGVVSWVNSPSTDHDWYEVGGTSSPNSITDNIYSQGNVAIGKNTIALDTKVDVENIDKTATLKLNNSYDIPSSTSDKYGIINTLNSTEYQTGIDTQLLGDAPSKIGYSVNMEGIMSNIGIGVNSRFETTGTGNQFGMYNTFASTTNTGNIWGIRNWYLSTSGYTGTLYGISNDFYNNNNGTHTAVNNLFVGTGSGTKYGVKNTFSGTSSGIFYGSYTDVTTNGAGAKYGAYNNLNTNGTKYGIYNNLVSIGSVAIDYGVYNKINNTGGSIGVHYGMYNEMLAPDNQYGVYTTMPNGSAYDQYGNYITIAGAGAGNRYGFYSTINSSAGGTHYGVYSNTTKAGSYAGYFIGDVYVSGTFTNPSDRVLKEHIRPTPSILDQLKQIQVQDYEFKLEDQEKFGFPKGTQTGFISQELETIFPGLVHQTILQEPVKPIDPKDPNKTVISESNERSIKSINYVGMIPLLTKAIQEQQVLIENSDVRIDQLETENQMLKSELEKLKTLEERIKVLEGKLAN